MATIYILIMIGRASTATAEFYNKDQCDAAAKWYNSQDYTVKAACFTKTL